MKKTKRRPQPPPRDPMLGGYTPTDQRHAVDRSRHHARLEVLAGSPEVRLLVDTLAALWGASHPLNGATEGSKAPGHHSTPPPGWQPDRISTTGQWDRVRKRVARVTVGFLEGGMESVSSRRKTPRIVCPDPTCGRLRALHWHKYCPTCGGMYPTEEHVA